MYLLGGLTLIIIANAGIYFYTQESESQRAESEDMDISALIAAGESDTVEFKSTLRINAHTNKSDKRIEYASLKTVAAFLNTDGGTLISSSSEWRTTARPRESRRTTNRRRA